MTIEERTTGTVLWEAGWTLRNLDTHGEEGHWWCGRHSKPDRASRCL